MNRVCLIGRLAQDPKSFEASISIVAFALAVREDEKNTSFIPVTCFGAVADVVSKYAKKGSLVGVEGVLRQRVYEDKDGQKKSALEVICVSLDLLDKKEDPKKTKKATAKAEA